MNRERPHEWVERLLNIAIVQESVERWYIHKDKLCIFFLPECVIDDHFNCIIVTFDLSWHKRVKSVKRFQVVYLWEDKFGHINMATKSDYTIAFKNKRRILTCDYTDGDTTHENSSIDVDFVSEIIVPRLKDEKYKRNEKFGL